MRAMFTEFKPVDRGIVIDRGDDCSLSQLHNIYTLEVYEECDPVTGFLVIAYVWDL